MGVGHSDKKMDRMAQDAIDAMNASGPRRGTGSKGKSGKGSIILIIIVILFLYLWLNDFSIGSIDSTVFVNTY